MFRPLCIAAVLAALVAGCGGDEPKKAATPSRSASATPAPSATPRAAERAAIDGWAKALSRSEVDRATGYFGVPLVIEQGKAFELRRRAEVRTFNNGLPCGAKLLSVRIAARYVIATFRLTDRPGRTCDSPGETARVAFRFRGDRISEWRQLPERVPEGEEPAAPPDAEPA